MHAQPAPELILGRPTATSMVVSVLADDGSVYFEYGDTPGKYTRATPAVTLGAGPVQALLDHLEPDRQYYYRAQYEAAGASGFEPGPEHTFHTQRKPGDAFSFTIQADSHQGFVFFHNPALYRVTLANEAADTADFLFDLGDAFSTDDLVETVDSVRQKYMNQRREFARVAHSIPVFLVLGNHENEEGWNLDDRGDDVADSLPVLGANARKRYFVNPIPDDFFLGNEDDSQKEIDGDHLKGDYYAFEWGDALFVAIDPFWYTMTKPYAGNTGGEQDDEVVGDRWDWTLGETQYEWLRTTLENSDARFKFVFAHHLVGGTVDYSRGGAVGAKYGEWGGYDVDGETWGFASMRPDFVMPIHDLLVANGVTIFFHGHDHVFATEELDGVVYQECPFAADASYSTGFVTNTEDYDGATLREDSGHVRVDVSAQQTHVVYERAFLPGDGTNRRVEASYSVFARTRDEKPIARDDEATTEPGRAIEVDVLANDSDPDDDLLAIAGVSQPHHGSVAFRAGAGVVEYRPEPEYCDDRAPDSFRYAIKDQRGGSRTARVEVLVRCACPDGGTRDGSAACVRAARDAGADAAAADAGSRTATKTNAATAGKTNAGGGCSARPGSSLPPAGSASLSLLAVLPALRRARRARRARSRLPTTTARSRARAAGA